MIIKSVFDKVPFLYIIKTVLFFLFRLGLGKKRLSILYKYISSSLFTEHSDITHLEAAMEWLKHAQDADKGDRGVSSGFF